MPKAVVLGGGLNSLAIVQSLGRRGIDAYVVADDLDDLVLRSRYATELPLERAGPDDDSLITALVHAAAGFQPKPVLFFTSDLYLRLVARYQERLAAAFVFLVPTVGQVDLVTDKALFAGFTELHALPAPRTGVPADLAGARELSRELQYPVVIKPNLSFHWRPRGVKIAIAEDAESFLAQWATLRSTTERLVVQEFIQSDDKEHFSFCAYRSPKDGELAYVTVQKLRVYPIHGGVGVFLRVVQDDELERVGRQALEALDYVGVASVCFKTDSTTGRRLIHEINGRLPAWHAAFRIAGVDLPYLMYADVLGLDRASGLTAARGANGAK